MSESEFYDSVDPTVTGEGKQWSYSTCTGTKKALLIGINYEGTPDKLRGCVNDALNLRRFITERWGYEDKDITMVTDNPKVSAIRATKENIVAQLKELVKDACQNDALFLFYSGHGRQLRNGDGKEIDGQDEAICPVDHDEEGYIDDDYLNELVVQPLPIGCRLTVIFDCCHSGSALDLLYTYGPEGHLEDGPSPNDAKKSPADIIYLSGSRDDQGAKDTEEEGQATGALSHAFVEALRRKPEQSYIEMLINTRNILVERKHDQVPQLSSSHPIDTSLGFII